jgi:ATP-dependent helicase/nuclease subunit A
VSGFNLSGVRVRKTFSKSRYGTGYRALAEQAFAELLIENSGSQTQQAAKNIQAMRKITFRELAERYIAEHLRPNTRSGANDAFVKTAILKWGDYALAQITVQAFRDWVRFALDNPIKTAGCADGEARQLQARTIEHVVTYTVRVFNWGIERGIIRDNPLAKVKDSGLLKELRRRKRRRHAVLSVEEFTAMVAEWPSFVRLPSMLSFYSGLRRGEVCGCRWSMIDRRRGCIHFEADETKEADAKTVFYDVEAEAVFEALEIERLTNGYADEYLFHGFNGEPLTVHSFSGAMRHYCNQHATSTGEEKYRKIAIHSLRRSYRTRKSTEGADPKAVAANMGHHSLTMSDHYDIATEERQRTVAGSGQGVDPAVLGAVAALVSSARAAGASLQDVQSCLRKEWMQAVKAGCSK